MLVISTLVALNLGTSLTHQISTIFQAPKTIMPIVRVQPEEQECTAVTRFRISLYRNKTLTTPMADEYEPSVLSRVLIETPNQGRQVSSHAPPAPEHAYLFPHLYGNEINSAA